MQTSFSRRWFAGLLSAAWLLPLIPAHAAWPEDQPIRIIVPQAAGGTNDTVARIVGVELGKALKQSVIVENRPGAAGAIGMEAVVKAKPDGYTLGLASDSAALLDVVRPNAAWKFGRDVIGIGMIGEQPIAVAVPANSPHRTLADLLQEARARSGKLAYGTSGVGSSQHIVGEWLASLAGVQVIHIPYKGGGQAITDLVGGQVPYAVLGLAPMLAQQKAGKVRVLAVTTPKRDASLPQVPTLTEQGFPQIALAQWAGIVAPDDLPSPVRQRLSEELERVLQLPHVRQQLSEAGIQPRSLPTGPFSTFLRDTTAMWTRLVTTLKLKLD